MSSAEEKNLSLYYHFFYDKHKVTKLAKENDMERAIQYLHELNFVSVLARLPRR